MAPNEVTEKGVPAVRSVKKREIRRSRLKGERLRQYAIERHGHYRKCLDEIVIGQDLAKEAGVKIAYLIDAHLRTGKPLGRHKMDTLFIGPPGCGKTLLCESISELVKVPYAGFPLTRVSSTGYVGGSVDDVFGAYAHRILADADIDDELMEEMDLQEIIESVPQGYCGIICYDELDKIIRPTGDAGSSTDQFKHDIQYELLDILHGTQVEVKMNPEETVTIDTGGITFLCAGAFDGLEAVIGKRLGMNPEKVAPQDLYKECVPDDLHQYGMDYQLARRFDKIVFLSQLDKGQLRRILTDSKISPMRLQQQKLSAFYGTELIVKKEVYDLVVDLALQDHKYGAGALTPICHDLTDPITSDIAAYVVGSQVILDLDLAKRHLRHRIERKSTAKRPMGFG